MKSLPDLLTLSDCRCEIPALDENRKGRRQVPQPRSGAGAQPGVSTPGAGFPNQITSPEGARELERHARLLRPFRAEEMGEGIPFPGVETPGSVPTAPPGLPRFQRHTCNPVESGNFYKVKTPSKRKEPCPERTLGTRRTHPPTVKKGDADEHCSRRLPVRNNESRQS
jgi:hypothetical protein